MRTCLVLATPEVPKSGGLRRHQTGTPAHAAMRGANCDRHAQIWMFWMHGAGCCS